MSQIVACPKCATQLQLPANFAGGQIKCPKCSQLLAVGATPDNAPTQQPPAPQQANPLNGGFPAAPANDPFGNLQNMVPPAQVPGNQFPAPAPNYRPPGPAPKSPQRRAPATGRKKKSGGTGVLMGLGIAFGCAFLICGGLIGLGLFLGGHSGWKQESLQGYTVNMPGRGKQKRDTTKRENLLLHEVSGQRRESGSQYSLVVTRLPKLPNGSSVTIKQLRDNPFFRMSGSRAVVRNGVQGLAGKTMAGFGQSAGAEIEVFIHKGDLVAMIYAPYHLIKTQVGGTMKPRSNERELDKPNEFFESIKFK